MFLASEDRKAGKATAQKYKTVSSKDEADMIFASCGQTFPDAFY
jgi:hypothetical protein